MENKYNNNIALAIDYITSEPKEGYVQVFANKSLFDAHRQSVTAKFRNEQPSLTWTGNSTLDGNGVRQFKFDDIILYNMFNKNTGKNIFLMREEDALALNIPRYIRKEAQEPAPFHGASFLSPITA